ncbi:hypothetical protein Ndes2526B_g09110 [Nannochloris sp. 'desiccata']
MNSAPSPSYGDVPPNPSSLSQDSADDVFLAGPHQPTRAQARLSIDKKSRPLAARVAPMKPSMKRHRCPTPQATHSQEEDDECLAVESPSLTRPSSSCATQIAINQPSLLRATPSLQSFSFRSCSESGGILSGSDSTTATDLEGSAQSPRRRSPTPHNNNTATPSVAGDTFDPELVRLFQVLRASEASSSINSNYLSTNHSPAHVSNNAFIDATIRSMCLIAVACLLVAAKHEEEMHPSVADLAAMAAHSFTAEDLLRMEALLLTSLKFCLAPPTSYTFLSVFKGLFSLRPQVFSLAAYYLEISMMEYSLLKISPSLLAAGAVVLAAGHYGDGVVLRALGKLIPGINIQVGPCLGSLQRVAENCQAGVYYCNGPYYLCPRSG